MCCLKMGARGVLPFIPAKTKRTHISGLMLKAHCLRNGNSGPLLRNYKFALVVIEDHVMSLSDRCEIIPSVRPGRNTRARTLHPFYLHISLACATSQAVACAFRGAANFNHSTCERVTSGSRAQCRSPTHQSGPIAMGTLDFADNDPAAKCGSLTVYSSPIRSCTSS